MKCLLFFFLFLNFLTAQHSGLIESANYIEIASSEQSYPHSFTQLQGYTTDDELALLYKKIDGIKRVATFFGVLSLAGIGGGVLLIKTSDDSAGCPACGYMTGGLAIGFGAVFGLIGLAQSGKVSKYEKQRAELINARNSSNQDIGFSLQLGVTNHGLGLKILF